MELHCVMNFHYTCSVINTMDFEFYDVTKEAAMERKTSHSDEQGIEFRELKYIARNKKL